MKTKTCARTDCANGKKNYQLDEQTHVVEAHHELLDVELRGEEGLRERLRAEQHDVAARGT